jgi:hypothetical protein
MSTPKIKIGLYGKGALKGMFVTFAQEAMPDAVFYERSIRFLSFRKREIELGKKNYVDPGTAVRDKPLEKMDVRVHFKQTQFTDDDIKTTVTAIHPVNLQKKVLHLSAKEDKITGNNVERVFRDQALRIVGAIRSLAMHPMNARVRADASLAGRPSTFEGTGIGRAIGRMQGPLGLH